ncbi:MAG: hypothetical protein KDA84_02040, partial [Planctomycetaceae bacterium]|nr:hypothetical protein [Planctomycetaceae bacterium]
MTFFPTTNVNVADRTITLPNHNLSTGDAVVYRIDPTISSIRNLTAFDASNVPRTELVDFGDVALGGLTDSFTYFVTVVDANTVRLSKTEGDALAADVIDLTSLGTGSDHRLNSQETQGIGISATFSGSDTLTSGATRGGSPSVDGLFLFPETAGGTAGNLRRLFPGSASDSVSTNNSEAQSIANDSQNDFLRGAAGLAINLFEHDVIARVGSSAILNSRANIEVTATTDQSVQIAPEGGSSKGEDESGSDVASAAAVGIGVYNNNVQAIIEENAVLNARESLTVSAALNYPLLSEPLDIIDPRSFAQDGLTGIGFFLDGTLGFSSNIMNTWANTNAEGDLVSIAGSFGVSVFNNNSEAVIRSGARINQDPNPIYRVGPQAVSVEASTMMELVEMTGIASFGLNLQGAIDSVRSRDGWQLKSPISGGLSGKNGLGGSVLFRLLDNTTIARIETGATIHTGDGGLTVSASEGIFSLAIAQSGGEVSSFGLAGSVLVTVQDSTTHAIVESGVNITGGGIDLDARSDLTLISIAGGVLQSEAIGVGVGVGVNVINRDTAAFIGNNAGEAPGTEGTMIHVTGDITVDTLSTGNLWSFTLSGSSISNKPLSGEGSSTTAGIGLPELGESTTPQGQMMEAIPARTGIGIAASAAVNLITENTRSFI